MNTKIENSGAAFFCTCGNTLYCLETGRCQNCVNVVEKKPSKRRKSWKEKIMTMSNLPDLPK